MVKRKTSANISGLWKVGPWTLCPAHGCYLIVALFIVVGIVYSLSTPVLEASDEFKHYPYVQYVQTNHTLPVLEPEVCQESPAECPWLQDGGQPPSYYGLMAAATSWIDTSDLPTLLWKNKHAFIGNPTQICNKNLIIHQPEQERFPWTGAVLAVHVIRLLTLLFGAGTVVLTYLLAQELFPGQPVFAVGASTLTAFNPMFLFVSASVNNDAMAAFLGSWALLIMVRIIDCRRTSSTTDATLIRRTMLLGLLIGLGILTKLSLLGLMPLALFVVAVHTWHQYSHELPLRRSALVTLHLLLIVLIAAAISGWWFLRNWRIYGDPTALNAFIAVQGRRAQAPALRDWIGEFGTFRWTYWGLFGGVNVMAPRGIYSFFDLISLAGLVGFVIWAVRRMQDAGRKMTTPDYRILIPALWAITLFISVLRWTWISPAFQGRLVFPGIAGISSLMVLGLCQWFPERYRAAVSLGVGALLLAIAALLPFIAIRPAYAQPEPLALSDIPKSVRVEPMDVGAVARVVGIDFEPQALEPVARTSVLQLSNKTSAHSVNVTVYWEAVKSDEKNYVSFARLLGREYELAGQINRHPACGMVPTGLWQPGQVWRDPFRIPIAKDARAPSRLHVEVGLYDPKAEHTLGAIKVGEAKLAPPKPPPEISYHTLNVKLADGVTLLGYDLAPADVNPGETLTVTLHWKARATPSRDYQVFVHVLADDAADSQPLAQGDGPPLMGDYPTSLWAAGETVPDPHPITLPADLAEQSGKSYQILVGMYNLETMERLPRADGTGASIEIPLTTARVGSKE